MNIENHKKIEALLYFYNEPVTYKKLANLLDISQDDVLEIANTLKQHYKDRGLQIIMSRDEVQLVAKINDEDLLDKLDASKQQQNLTPAVVETLAVVAYLKDATEPLIDAVRGVKSGRTLKRLTRQGYLTYNNESYELSVDALRQLGIIDGASLPELSSLQLKLKALANSNDS